MHFDLSWQNDALIDNSKLPIILNLELQQKSLKMICLFKRRICNEY